MCDEAAAEIGSEVSEGIGAEVVVDIGMMRVVDSLTHLTSAECCII